MSAIGKGEILERAFAGRSLWADARFALRQLAKNIGFAATAIIILALGIGACTAIFSLVNAVLIRSLPYGDPGRLVYLLSEASLMSKPMLRSSAANGLINTVVFSKSSSERSP